MLHRNGRRVDKAAAGRQVTAQHQIQFPACAPHDWRLPEIGDVRLDCRWCGAESSPLRRWPDFQMRAVADARRTADREAFAGIAARSIDDGRQGTSTRSASRAASAGTASLAGGSVDHHPATG